MAPYKHPLRAAKGRHRKDFPDVAKMGTNVGVRVGVDVDVDVDILVRRSTFDARKRQIKESKER